MSDVATAPTGSAGIPPGGTAAHVYDYREGGAGDERTVRANTEDLDALGLVPRMLRGVVRPDLRTTVVGGELTAPLLVSPMGLQAMYHPGAEAVSAAAAAELGLGFCLSAMSSADADTVRAAARPGLLWRQVYLLGEDRLTHQLIDDAERLGFSALVCTVDVPVLGRRSRDQHNGFDRFAAFPPALVSSPAFRELVAERGQDPRAVLDSVFPNPACTWDDLAAVVRRTRLPVLVKGVLDPRDARRALEAGAAGIVASNHGGRQFDRSPSAVGALPGIRDAVADEVPVYLDSGVRSGTHAAVALALGASAVLVGRPVLRALAAGGRAGVVTALRSVRDELSHVMTLVGAHRPEELRDVRVVGGQSWTPRSATPSGSETKEASDEC